MSGRLETVALEDGTDHVSRFVRLRDGSTVPVSFPGIAARDLPTEGRVTGTVRLTGDAAASVGGGTTSTATAEGRSLATALAARGALHLHQVSVTAVTAPVQPTPAAHHAYVAIVDGVGTYNGMTDADLLARVHQATDFWVDQSDGVISSFDAQTKHVTSAEAASRSGCGLGSGTDTEAVWNEVDDQFPGVDFDHGSNHLLVLLPDECPVVSAIGMGRLGSSLASGGRVLFQAERPDAVSTLTHEMGHNFSLMHANVKACSPYNPDYCPGGEYGDYYDVMSNDGKGVLPALSSVNRSDLGLLGAGETERVELPMGDASRQVTARIHPRSDSTGQRSLTVVDPEDDRTYLLDYRAGTGRDAGATYTTNFKSIYDVTFGTGLTVLSTNGDRSSSLWTHDVDVNDHRGAWQEGEEFVSQGGITVHVDHVEPGQYVDVTVTLATDLAVLTGKPAPSLTGTPEVGETLLLDPHWDAWPDTAYFDVQWLVDGQPVYRGQVDEQPWMMPLTLAMRGSTVQAKVTAHAEGYRSLTQSSEALGPVTRPIHGFLYLYPSFVDARVGEVIFGGGGFSPESATATYQWYADGEPITGATGRDYTPTQADVGAMLTQEAVASAPGYDTTTVVSDPVGPVLSAGGGGGLTTATPTISGQPLVGNTLTANHGAWSTGATFTYQWTRGGSPIADATGTTYRLVSADLGEELAVQVTGYKSGLQATETSDSVTVQPGVLKSPTPTVSGKPRVGKRLTANAGTWTSGTTLTYQWRAGTRALPGATGQTYKLPASAKGKKISVVVTGSKAGYTTVSKTSAATAKVR